MFVGFTAVVMVPSGLFGFVPLAWWMLDDVQWIYHQRGSGGYTV